MSEWQPGIIIDLHKEIKPTMRWQKLIGKKVYVREYAEGQADCTESHYRRYLIRQEDVDRLVGYTDSKFVVCEHEILTD